jgi:hypothetical protein
MHGKTTIKNATELTEEYQPVHSKANIKLNTGTFYPICTLYVKNQRLTSNRSIS